MGQKGITLIELIVVMAIAGVIGWLVVSSFINLNDTLSDQDKTVDLQSAGRETIDKMVRVLREAGLNPLEDEDINGIEEATATKLRVVLDSNLSGEIEEGEKERVTFEFVNGSLRRCYDEDQEETPSCANWVILSDSISDLDTGGFYLPDGTNKPFRYFDADNADLGEPGEDPEQLDKIKAIEVRLELSDDKAKQRGDINRVFTTTVRGRNL
ncbi:MAG: prepilin-type N-terminal cleavage/methylation domain-containing protein [Trichloromonas sp.]|jgi:prepilin-type N-terminal cleavage/methylation domain-containing protein|nr:prepilin-type N-terminal cleavage/methylation domain-containing protein [Trichloromonas sp.]